jgi:hypothetical protein
MLRRRRPRFASDVFVAECRHPEERRPDESAQRSTILFDGADKIAQPQLSPSRAVTGRKPSRVPAAPCKRAR